MTCMTRRVALEDDRRKVSRNRGWDVDAPTPAIKTTFRRMVACLVSTILAVAWMGGVVPASEIFFDDFSDGDVMNDVPVTSEGVPVHWTTGGNRPGIRDASSGDYVFTSVPESEDFIASDVLDLTLGDTSIRGQVRSTAVGGAVGFAVRNQDPVDRHNYHGLIMYRPEYGGTILYLGRRDGDSWAALGNPVPLSFDIRHQDAMLQLDAIDNELKLWGWRAGDPMPATPQLAAQDTRYESGFVRIAAGSGNNNDNIATLRFVRVADTHISKRLLPGDHNDNGAVEQADLDLVLLNWGTVTPRIPDGWTGIPPQGLIAQAELDDVLLNWGKTSAAAAVVPEPASMMLLLAGIAIALLRSHRVRDYSVC